MNLDNQLVRSKALNNIPNKKWQLALSEIEQSTNDLQIKNIKITAVNRYVESNIPLEYWSLKMEKDFVGDHRLKTKYDEYVKDLKLSYINGSSLCLAGNSGTGKTMTQTSILKKACLKGYTCLYTDLSQIVSVLTSAGFEEKFLAKRELSLVDFLFIDECDNRFFSNSDSAGEMFGRTIEGVLRTRLQNKLPTLMATNSPNLKNSFTSMFQQSLGSLMNKIVFLSVFGEDFRKIK